MFKQVLLRPYNIKSNFQSKHWTLTYHEDFFSRLDIVNVSTVQLQVSAELLKPDAKPPQF